MKITGLEATLVAVPLRKPFTAFYKTYEVSRHILIRLHTDEGVTGVAECAGGDVAEATLAVVQHYLGPAVIGLDPREMDLLHRRMDEASAHQYRAKNGIDQAAYDVAGKAAGLSVAELMGGRYRDAVPVCDVIGIGPPEEVAEAARDVLDRGFKQVKLKAGRDFQRDLQTVEAVRMACGDALQIRLDINGGYRSAAVALPICKRLEAAGVDIFEQPVEPSDLAGMALVTKALDAPVLAHESLFTIGNAVTIIAMKAADILNISPPRAGGLYPALQMVRWAELKNVPVMMAPWRRGSVISPRPVSAPLVARSPIRGTPGRSCGSQRPSSTSLSASRPATSTCPAVPDSGSRSMRTPSPGVR